MTRPGTIHVRPLAADDLDAADAVMRLAFGTFRELPDPTTTFGDAEFVRTRFRAAPDWAWVAQAGDDVIGSAFATRWGSFGCFGPLTVHPAWWDRNVGSLLLEPVMDALRGWDVRQAGLFTFPNSPKHLGLYQKHGFWPGHLTAVMARATAQHPGEYLLFSHAPDSERTTLLSAVAQVTNDVFAGLDLEHEIRAVEEQRLGDTVLVPGEDDGIAGLAICHCGAGSEAGSGTCYVKFGAVRPRASAEFIRLLDACNAFAATSGCETIVAGVNTGRLDAYRRLLARGFRTRMLGVSMQLAPDGADFNTSGHYVLDDLR